MAVVVFFLLCVAALDTAPLAWAGLVPDQVVVVANSNNRASIRVAEHYAAQRGIPSQQIITLALPPDETISRRDYDRLMVMPLRQALRHHNLQKRVRVVVTVYGVPLRVGPPLVSAQEQGLRQDVTARLEVARSRLTDVDRQARLIGPPSSGSESTAEKESGLPTHDRNLAFFFRVNQAVHQVLRQVRQQQPMDPQAYARLESLFRVYQGRAGLAEVHHTLPQSSVGPRREEHDSRVEQLEGLRLLIESLELPVRRQRADFYRRIELVYGQYGVFALAAMELDALSDELGDASVDSELSLLWWDRGDYSVAWRYPNPFHHAAPSSTPTTHRDIPVLMVSRLDAPTAELAMQLVDRAMEAEKEGPAGTVYLDAQGLPEKPPSDTYTTYDRSLQRLHAFLGEHSAYRSILENTKARFEHPGQAPDVAFYAGWYRLRHYEDAFVFRPGAIGYHMASAEAISLHQPGETGWCKNALEHGITATLGPVGEPYLDAFPEPLEFTALLMTGHYTLVEAYYLMSRWVSWRMVLVGDPLYNPWGQRPAVKRSALSMFPLAPIAPSDRTFGDPIRAKEERRRGYEQSWMRLDEILRRQEQGPSDSRP